MKLFEFELSPIENIHPWGEEPNLSLSWFALTDGVFRFNVGNDVLFRYSKDIIRHWELTAQDADYQIAAFARDFLGSIAAALKPIPSFLQPIAWDWKLLREVLVKSNEHDSSYEAFRWLGERSPFTSYLTQCPEISFIRKENEIIIGWDNRCCLIDGLQVWESSFGMYIVTVDDFIKECRSFADRILDDMQARIVMITSGEIKAQIPLDPDELLKQHESWREEFDEYFSRQDEPDFSWDETEKAINLIIKELKIEL